MDEQRTGARSDVNTSATIESEGRAYSCTVRNLSAAGAALDVPHAQAVPDAFKLVMDATGASRQCRVVWRRENRLGIAF